MRTKFELDQKVWYLDVIKATIAEAQVLGVIADKENGEVYRVSGDSEEDGVVLPADALFSSREGCRAFYLKALGGR